MACHYLKTWPPFQPVIKGGATGMLIYYDQKIPILPLKKPLGVCPKVAENNLVIMQSTRA